MRIVNGIKVVCADIGSLLKREIDFYKIRPKTSTLFLTYRCNSKCKTCSMWKRPQREEVSKEIDLKSWRIVVDKLADTGIKSTEIFGGNVLLRKEVLIPILKYLYTKNIAVHLPTNQIGLDNDVAEAIARYVDTAYISMDGLGDQQDSIRGIEGACSYSENSIVKLIRCRTNNNYNSNRLRIVCNYTVSRFNIDYMEDVAQYAVINGFDEVHFEYAGEFNKCDVERSIINGITPEPYYVKQETTILADKAGARKIKNNLIHIKKKYKKCKTEIISINIDTLSTGNLFKGTIPHGKCYVERGEITIDPYGNIVICPFINNYTMGNLLENNFKEIWNNELHKCFRKTQNSGGLPMCRHCILGVQRNPGLLKSLGRIYLTRIKPLLSC